MGSVLSSLVLINPPLAWLVRCILGFFTVTIPRTLFVATEPAALLSILHEHLVLTCSCKILELIILKGNIDYTDILIIILIILKNNYILKNIGLIVVSRTYESA